MTVHQHQPLFQSATAEPTVEHPVAEHDEDTMRKLRNPFTVDEQPVGTEN